MILLHVLVSLSQNTSFGNIVLEDKECHKHLGLTFQSNCKCEKHINSIIRKVTLLISCLRSFKYRLCRRALDTMYKSFILPQFDYADIVWDNCSGTLLNMLKNLHLEAIRIILGAVRGTSHENLYKVSGFCTLNERRKRHKLLMFHKMIYHQCPGYLSNLVPPLVSTTNPYHRRRPHERVIPRTVCKFIHSFIKQNCMQIHSFRQLPKCGTHYLKLYKQILQLAC